MLPGTCPPANVNAPAEWILLMEWKSDENPLPVDLQLDAFVVADNVTSFPKPRIALHAGSTYFTDVDGFVGIIRLELGQGPNARTIYADLKGGRYALGSQERVRVSMCRWQTSLLGNANIRVEAGISETDGSGEYLTYTMAQLTVAPGSDLAVQFPPGAAWWEYYSAGDFRAAFSSGDTYNFSERLAAQSPPVYEPPSSPLPVSQGALTLTNIGVDPASVVVVIWVR